MKIDGSHMCLHLGLDGASTRMWATHFTIGGFWKIMYLHIGAI